MTDRLRVAEVFGPTIQGEGPAAGRSAGFVRLMGCNLSCSWCDTAWTWNAEQDRSVRDTTTLLTPGEIVDRLPRSVALYVLTGGEPLLQQNSAGFGVMLSALSALAPVHVETNGTTAPSPAALEHVTTWVVSPKLGNAGPHRGRQNSALHQFWCGGSCGAHLKVVCRDSGDVERAVVFADSVGWPRQRVWLMPEGTTTGVLADRWQIVAEGAAKHGVNASHRLHVLAWGEERGR